MSAKKKSPQPGLPQPGKFIWNELVAANPAKAKKFYTGLFGWQAVPFGKGIDYTLFKLVKNQDGLGGMMKCPVPGAPSHWLPYVCVADVDKSVAKAKKLGAELCVGPLDVPTVGRLAVFRDPQGAAIGIFMPKM